MALTADGGGYWLVTDRGEVMAFGDAAFHGSAAGLAPGDDVVSITATSDGGGYWLLSAAGRVLNFGDAPYFGSAPGEAPASPAVGLAATPDGGGYWVATAGGGVLSFGDARYDGSSSDPPGASVAAIATGSKIEQTITPAPEPSSAEVGSTPIAPTATAPSGLPVSVSLDPSSAPACACPGASSRSPTPGPAPSSTTRPATPATSPPPRSASPSPWSSPRPRLPFGILRLRHLQLPVRSSPPAAPPIGDRGGDRRVLRRPQPVPRRRGRLGRCRPQPLHVPHLRPAARRVHARLRRATTACNAGYAAAQYAFDEARQALIDTSVTWWLDVEQPPARIPSGPPRSPQRGLRPGGGGRAAGRRLSPPWASTPARSPGLDRRDRYQPDLPLWLAWYTGDPAATARPPCSYAAANGVTLPTGPHVAHPVRAGHLRRGLRLLNGPSPGPPGLPGLPTAGPATGSAAAGPRPVVHGGAPRHQVGGVVVARAAATGRRRPPRWSARRGGSAAGDGPPPTRPSTASMPSIDASITPA